MMRITRLFTVAALAALPLASQEPGRFSCAASLAQGTESLKNLTGQTSGFGLEGAWDAPASIGPLRIGIALSQFGKGTHAVGVIREDERLQIQADGPSLFTQQLYVAARGGLTEKLILHFGVSANRHRLGSDLDGTGGSRSVEGTKLGLRASLGYALHPNLTLEGTFQWVEVGLAPDRSHLQAPSWFQVGARWTF